jgi:hypothetical protein
VEDGGVCYLQKQVNHNAVKHRYNSHNNIIFPQIYANFSILSTTVAPRPNTQGKKYHINGIARDLPACYLAPFY